MLLSCKHPNYTWPQTRKKRELATGIHRPSGTFVTCLSCGKEMYYDFERMCIVSDKELRKKAIDRVYGDV
jgi:RNase P subunit RPR2